MNGYSTATLPYQPAIVEVIDVGPGKSVRPFPESLAVSPCASQKLEAPRRHGVTTPSESTLPRSSALHQPLKRGDDDAMALLAQLFYSFHALTSDRVRLTMENAALRQDEARDGDIISTPVLNGLHHTYRRSA